MRLLDTDEDSRVIGNAEVILARLSATRFTFLWLCAILHSEGRLALIRPCGATLFLKGFSMSKNTRRLGRGLNSLIGEYGPAGSGDEGDRVVVQAPQEAGGSEETADSVVPPGSTSQIAGEGGRASVAVPAHGARADAGKAVGGYVQGGRVADTIEARMVAVEELRPNREQPRRKMDDASVRELARSISASGVIQPIIVRREPWGLEIIAGERRWRAAQLAGLTSVPVVVRDASDEKTLELALVENIHREDLNAVDRATAYRRYCDEFGVTADQLAMRLGEDRTTVTNYLRLLELPGGVRDLLTRGQISMGHARSLAGVPDDVRKEVLAEIVASRGLSVRALENLIRRERRRRGSGTKAATEKEAPKKLPATVRDLERRFEEVLETKVTIELEGSKARGRIVVAFYNVDDFERICRKTGVIREGAEGTRGLTIED